MSCEDNNYYADDCQDANAQRTVSQGTKMNNINKCNGMNNRYMMSCNHDNELMIIMLMIVH